jgi:hypothetical protein
MDWDTKLIQTIAYDNFLKYIITGGGILGIFKAILWLQGFRIISFVRVYWNKKEFLNHSVFYKINDLLKNKFLINTINDLGKKEIANDLIHLEILRVKQILKNNLKFLFKKNVINYLQSFSEFDSATISKLFINEFINSKSQMESFARNKLTRNNQMSQQDFNRFWPVYVEFTNIYEMVLHESIHLYLNRKNVYGSLWDILDHFEMLVELMSKTLGHQINSMNGRLDGVTYKGRVIGSIKKETTCKTIN